MKPELKSKIPNVVMNLTDGWIEKTKDAIAFTDEKGKRLIATATHNGLKGGLEEGEAVAELIHEAFTVFSRTNKTPGELEEELRWVSIDERKPDRGVCVLVYLSESKVVTIAYLSQEKREWLLFGDVNKCLPVDLINDEVTHWRPLPSPPTA